MSRPPQQTARVAWDDCGERSDHLQTRRAAPDPGDIGSDAACTVSTFAPVPAPFAETARPTPSLGVRRADPRFGEGPTPSALRLPVALALDVIGERRRILILWQLFWGARPYGELMRALVGVSKKNLRHELVALERSGLVRRVVRENGNRRAQYKLTAFGETLKPLLAMLYDWGLALQKQPSRSGFSSPARDWNA